MDRKPVGSSNIASVGYDAPERVLEVEFKKGGVYRYKGVSQNTHDGLMAAESKGKYFYANIRNVYEWEKAS